MVSAREPRQEERPMRKYVRPADVVRNTGLSKSTVMQALWSGELKAFRKGRAWLIPAEAVEQWIQGDGYAA